MTRYRRLRLGARLGAVAALAPLLALAACGSHGYAPALGNVATIALKGASGQALGSASFSPTYATHIATYYRAKAVPFEGAQTPLELRADTCTGKTLAALTAATAAPITNGPLVAVDPHGGVDVATTMNGNLYVVVRDHANDASAPLLACGHPLDGRRQFFDLYTPGAGSNGYELGITLMEPIVATQTRVTLAAPATQPVPWAVRLNSCSGQPLAQGQIAAGAQSATSAIFSPLDASKWTVTIGAACAKVGA